MTDDIATLGLLDDEEIELDHAALALSALDHEGVDLDPYLTLLDDIEDALAIAAVSAQTPRLQSEALAQVLAGEFEFKGDRDSYDAPLNADLIRVLDRRRGLPVSLSILYVAAARRMGWTAHALGTPGHVVVSIGGGDAATMIDPFNYGLPISSAQLVALIRGALGADTVIQPQHVAPMANRAVLVRLLLNQASRAEQSGDPLRALTVYTRMTVVAPQYPDGWWELARLQLQLDDVDAARDSLSAMLEVTRDPERRRLVTATLAAIASG